MAILFVTHKFPPSIGGMQKQSYELINGIRKHTKVFTIAISPAESKFWFYLRLKSRIKTKLRNHPEIDMVHCNDAVTASFCSWLSACEGVKLTATFHGLDIVFPNQIFQNYIVPKLRRFDKVFCVSRATANACLERGFDPKKIAVIHNGVDIQLKDIASDPSALARLKETYNIDFEKTKVLLGVGRAVKRKGFSWFIKTVLPNINNTTFVMVGPMENTSSLLYKILSRFPRTIRRQVELMFGYASDSGAIQEALKTTKNAIHLSHVPFEDLMQIYACSSLFVMPNVSVKGDMEGFGLVALEAVLRRCPVVAANIEGVKDAISHGNNGVLLPSKNASEWSKGINVLLKDSDKRKALSAKALAYTVDNFSWDKMCQDYWSSFQKLSYEDQTISVKDMVLVA